MSKSVCLVNRPVVHHQYSSTDLAGMARQWSVPQDMWLMDFAHQEKVLTATRNTQDSDVVQL